jgi:DNA (cytosine-5)-methyltransferase 1
MLTHISLFAGMGGDTLAAEWAGFETVLLCEIDKNCQKVLRKHWPGVPIIGDVRDVTRESVIANTGLFRQAQRQEQTMGIKERGKQSFTDAASFRCDRRKPEGQRIQRQDKICSEIGTGFELTLLTAGVPCQPASTAGKRRGKADDRWIWPETIRVLHELKPAWFVGENPTGIGSLGEFGGLFEVGEETHKGEPNFKANEFWNELPDREAVELSNIIRDIETEGYEVQPVSIPACAVGAPHRRQRIFIVAHTRISRSQQGCQIDTNARSRGSRIVIGSSNQPDTDAEKQGLEGAEPEGNRCAERLFAELGGYADWQRNWLEVARELCAQTQPGVRTLDDGLSTGLAGLKLSRVAKLKMLGNAIVPEQIYPVFKAIAEIEANQ